MESSLSSLYSAPEDRRCCILAHTWRRLTKPHTRLGIYLCVLRGWGAGTNKLTRWFLNSDRHWNSLAQLRDRWLRHHPRESGLMGLGLLPACTMEFLKLPQWFQHVLKFRNHWLNSFNMCCRHFSKQSRCSEHLIAFDCQDSPWSYHPVLLRFGHQSWWGCDSTQLL